MQLRFEREGEAKKQLQLEREYFEAEARQSQVNGEQEAVALTHI